MSTNLQQYIITLLSDGVYSGTGFLSINITSNFNITSTPHDYALAQSLAYIFMSADLLLYFGVVAVISVLGLSYHKTGMRALASILLRTSATFIYGSLLINLLGFAVGSDFIYKFSILVFENSYSFNIFSQALKVLMLLILLCLHILFPTTLPTRMRVLELPVLLQISAALCSTIISATNFALLLLALEGFSLSLYIMTALGRNYGGVTASVKYFAFGTLGSIFLFWGVVHLYALIPSLSFEVINFILDNISGESPSVGAALDFANTAIAFGFMLKLGAAPVHQWVADVYAGAHMYITAFFAVFVKFVLFVVFVKVVSHFNCNELLNLFTIFSLVTGCLMSINQTEIKRLLAYSSIVHVAFLFMGDVASSLIYLLTYVVSSLAIFSVLLTIELAGKEIVYLNDLKFIRSSGYFNTTCLIVALASSAGLPPFAGFYGKFLVWSSLIEDIYLTNSVYSYIVLFLSIFVSLITIFYYMRVLAYMFIGSDEQNRSTEFTVDTPTFNSIVHFQLTVIVLLVFWTLLQPYLLPLIQFSILCV